MISINKRTFSSKEKENFRKYAESHAPKSHIVKDTIIAFIVGGLICILGQVIFDFYRFLDISKENTKILVSVTLIFLSVLFTGLGYYRKLAKFSGGGTLVPITGFANAVSSPAIDSKAEGFVLGVASNMFIIAGPVIVYGSISSIIYGVIYYLFLR